MLHPIAFGWGCFFIYFCQKVGGYMELDDDLFPLEEDEEDV